MMDRLLSSDGLDAILSSIDGASKNKIFARDPSGWRALLFGSCMPASTKDFRKSTPR
jgi:hypothetical protein